MIAIVDYKAGNLTSVKLAFDALGIETVKTCDPEVVRNATRVVFPGVGAAKSAMENLEKLGLVDAIKEAALTKPFLGICLGMQILFEESEEDGGVKTLGILPGKVKRFPNIKGVKVPHIGWSEDYYFVHSYFAPIIPETTIECCYAGVEFTAALKRGTLTAAQFHPEKSGRLGLEFLKEWATC